ncbi:MAG: hypothetical protein AAF763_19775, partial [Pseudomonadota bacterium]
GDGAEACDEERRRAGQRDLRRGPFDAGDVTATASEAGPKIRPSMPVPFASSQVRTEASAWSVLGKKATVVSSARTAERTSGSVKKSSGLASRSMSWSRTMGKRDEGRATDSRSNPVSLSTLTSTPEPGDVNRNVPLSAPRMETVPISSWKTPDGLVPSAPGGASSTV